MNFHERGNAKFLDDVDTAMRKGPAPRNLAVVMHKHPDGIYSTHLTAFCPSDDILFAATYLLHIIAGTASGTAPLVEDEQPILAALDALPSIVEIMYGPSH